MVKLIGLQQTLDELSFRLPEIKWFRFGKSAARNRKTVGKSNVKGIGRYPAYLNLSEDLGVKPFTIPGDVWNKMSKEEQWAANQKFLDRAIEKNSVFVLASPLKNAGTYYAKEIEYLVGKGYHYEIWEEGIVLVKS